MSRGYGWARNYPADLRQWGASVQHGTPETRDVTEGAFLAEVLRLAKQNAWEAYHTHDSRKSESGFPDLVLCRPGNPGSIIFAELKTRTGKLSVAQQRWLSVLEHTGLVEACLWRPADMPAIVARLTGGRP